MGKVPNELKQLGAIETRNMDTTNRYPTRSRITAQNGDPNKNQQKKVPQERKPVVPAKRNRRQLSLPCVTNNLIDSFLAQSGTVSTTVEFVNKQKKRKTSTQERAPSVPAKRNRRQLSMPCDANVSSVNSSSEQSDTLSKVIGLNCRLTNELLNSKKHLSQKTDDLLEMQRKFYEKQIECNNLLSLLTTKDAEIVQLKSALEKIYAQQFCDDLIDFEDCEG